MQLSATSQGPLAVRHTVAAAAKPSAGQADDAPVQASATSHGPLSPRHNVPACTKPSPGHCAELPVQLSATSQTPFAERHTVPAAARPSSGHCAALPVQLSATSQAPFAARHTVPAAARPLAGHCAPDPSQTSGASQAPALARQIVPAATGVCWQLTLAPLPTSVSMVQGLPSSQLATQFCPSQIAWPAHTLPLQQGCPGAPQETQVMPTPQPTRPGRWPGRACPRPRGLERARPQGAGLAELVLDRERARAQALAWPGLSSTSSGTSPRRVPPGRCPRPRAGARPGAGLAELALDREPEAAQAVAWLSRNLTGARRRRSI